MLRIPARSRHALAALTIALVAGPAAAAGSPQVVEEAILIPPGSFSLSAWREETRSTNARSTFLSAYMRGEPAIQFGIEYGEHRNRAGRSSETLELNAKALARELHTDGYGFGVKVGTLYSDDDDRFERTYVLLPFTIEPARDRVRLHLNAGAESDRRMRGDQEALLWGAATDVRLTQDLAVRGEIFGDDRGDDPDVLAGLQWNPGDTGLSIRTTWRRNLDSGSRETWSIGIGYGVLRF